MGMGNEPGIFDTAKMDFYEPAIPHFTRYRE